MMFQYFAQMKKETLDGYMDMIRDEYEITVSAYSETADLIFETLINTKDIKSTFAEGLMAENPEPLQ